MSTSFGVIIMLSDGQAVQNACDQHEECKARLATLQKKRGEVIWR